MIDKVVLKNKSLEQLNDVFHIDSIVFYYYVDLINYPQRTRVKQEIYLSDQTVRSQFYYYLYKEEETVYLGLGEYGSDTVKYYPYYYTDSYERLNYSINEYFNESNNEKNDLKPTFKKFLSNYSSEGFTEMEKIIEPNVNKYLGNIYYLFFEDSVRWTSYMNKIIKIEYNNTYYEADTIIHLNRIPADFKLPPSGLIEIFN